MTAVLSSSSGNTVAWSAVHEPGSRPCVHLLTRTPPSTLLLDRDVVGRLNFQPRVCTPPMPCIASRVGDVLTLGFDSRSVHVGGNHHTPKGINPALRWHYQLHATDDINVVAAVMIPPAVVVRDGTNH